MKTAEKHSKYTSKLAPVKVSDVGEPAIPIDHFIIKEVHEVIAT